MGYEQLLPLIMSMFGGGEGSGSMMGSMTPQSRAQGLQNAFSHMSTGARRGGMGGAPNFMQQMQAAQQQQQMQAALKKLFAGRQRPNMLPPEAMPPGGYR